MVDPICDEAPFPRAKVVILRRARSLLRLSQKQVVVR
jgi:hypothetical protein